MILTGDTLKENFYRQIYGVQEENNLQYQLFKKVHIKGCMLNLCYYLIYIKSLFIRTCNNKQVYLHIYMAVTQNEIKTAAHLFQISSAVIL